MASEKKSIKKEFKHKQKKLKTYSDCFQTLRIVVFTTWIASALLWLFFRSDVVPNTFPLAMAVVFFSIWGVEFFVKMKLAADLKVTIDKIGEFAERKTQMKLSRKRAKNLDPFEILKGGLKDFGIGVKIKVRHPDSNEGDEFFKNRMDNLISIFQKDYVNKDDARGFILYIINNTSIDLDIMEELVELVHCTDLISNRDEIADNSLAYDVITSKDIAEFLKKRGVKLKEKGKEANDETSKL